jgi:phosphatidylglycerol---prolipoprotein diacylglyceryl transferase
VTPAQAIAIHAVFQWAAILTGSQLYLRSLRLSLTTIAGPRFAVLIGCIVGAGLGSKAAYLSYNPASIDAYIAQPALLLSGQSIVGGLLGGWIGVELAKYCVGVRQSTGDHFVVPVLIGLVIGRIGCFMTGLYDETSGTPSSVPWAHDYGDGVPRHPTQLYDIMFAAVALLAHRRLHRYVQLPPGAWFKLLMCTYLAFRLAVDFLKPAPTRYFGMLSGIQLACCLGLWWFIPWTWQQLRSMAPRTGVQHEP